MSSSPTRRRARPPRRLASRALLVRRTPYGESSLIVHALTETGARVELIAKGAHRPKSRFSGVLDWFDTLELGWTATRDADLGTLREGEIGVRRRGLTRSLSVYRAALTVVELLDVTTRAASADAALFALAERALDELDGLSATADGADPSAPAAALLAAFELQLLGHLGLAPALTACAACGEPAPAVDATAREARVPFSAAGGGRLCAIHANEAHASGVRVGTLPEAVLLTAESALRSPLDAAGAADWPEGLAERVLDFAGRFLDHHLETRPKSQARFLSSPDRNRRSARPTRPS